MSTYPWPPEWVVLTSHAFWRVPGTKGSNSVEVTVIKFNDGDVYVYDGGDNGKKMEDMLDLRAYLAEYFKQPA